MKRERNRYNGFEVMLVTALLLLALGVLTVFMGQTP
jgi:hypothetical protein